jgi:hypothetical protein
LDEKLRYLAELASRKHRRTISSFIEWAIAISLDRVWLNEGQPEERISVNDAAPQLWDIDPADRLVKLAFRYPELLNHEEQVMWKLICSRNIFWKGQRNAGQEWKIKTSNESKVSLHNLRNYWETLGQIARGEKSASAIPDMDHLDDEADGTGGTDIPPAPIEDEDISF